MRPVILGSLWLSLTATVTGGTALALDPAFAGSTIAAQPASVVAGEPFEAIFTLVYAGDTTPLVVVHIPIPPDLLLADQLDRCAPARREPRYLSPPV